MRSAADRRCGVRRPLVLTGMPGSGKSSLLRWLHHLTLLSTADLDDLFTRAHDKTPAQSIETEGEEAFRVRERFLATTLLSPKPTADIYAFGGGTLAMQEMLNWTRERATVVFLHCDLEELERRVGLGQERPLLKGEPVREALKRLWTQREPYYRQADYTLDVTRLRPAEAAWRVAEHFGLAPRVSTAFLDHPHALGWFESGEALSLIRMCKEAPAVQLSSFLEELAPSSHRVLVVDRGLPEGLVRELTEALPAVPLVQMGPGESAKQLERLPEHLEQLRRAGVHRDSLVVVAGGGALLDAAGFACSVYMRGVSTVLVPTTPLAAIDASVGGKTAMDVAGAKNLCGSFAPPLGVLVPWQWLASPNQATRRALAGELLKVAILGGDVSMARAAARMATSDSALECDLLANAVACKVGFIFDDLKDKYGRRAFLNLGHTFGHALESALHYRLSHGECVGAGLVVAARLSRHLGLADPQVAAGFERLAVRAGLWPVAGLPPVQELLRALQCDKKQEVDSIRWVLLQDWGVPVLRRLPKMEMENLLSAIL